MTGEGRRQWAESAGQLLQPWSLLAWFPNSSCHGLTNHVFEDDLISCCTSLSPHKVSGRIGWCLTITGVPVGPTLALGCTDRDGFQLGERGLTHHLWGYSL